MQRLKLIIVALTFGIVSVFSLSVFAKKVNITAEIASVTVKHINSRGKTTEVVIKRNQNTKNVISKHYSFTSRPCPPFCVQPMNQFAPHKIEVIDEVEVIEYAKKASSDKSVMLVDSRTSDWIILKSGTIPSATNIPWTLINPAKGATPEKIASVVSEEFGVQVNEDGGPYNFNNAKTLVLFCNGMWCGQSPSNIKTLLSIGYPAAKIKWYRGGMQAWETLGLTTVNSARIVR